MMGVFRFPDDDIMQGAGSIESCLPGHGSSLGSWTRF
jgi:hypothetical protein